MFGIGAIDAFYGDRERAVFESSYPSLFLSDTRDETPDAPADSLTSVQDRDCQYRFVDVLSALEMKHRQQLVLNVDLPSDAFTASSTQGPP